VGAENSRALDADRVCAIGSLMTRSNRDVRPGGAAGRDAMIPRVPASPPDGKEAA